MMMGVMKNPPDAVKLSEFEAKQYIDGLQGGQGERPVVDLATF